MRCQPASPRRTSKSACDLLISRGDTERPRELLARGTDLAAVPTRYPGSNVAELPREEYIPTPHPTLGIS